MRSKTTNILNEHDFAPHIITHIVKTMYGTDLCAGLQKLLLYQILRRSPMLASYNILQAFGVIGPICIMVGLANPFSIGIKAKYSETNSSAERQGLTPLIG